MNTENEKLLLHRPTQQFAEKGHCILERNRKEKIQIIIQGGYFHETL